MPYPSYSYNGPAASSRDAVRFYLGDVGPDEFVMPDEDITYLLTKYPQVLSAAGHGAQQLAARYASKIDRAVGDLRVDYSQLMDHYTKLADSLLTQSKLHPARVYVGGVRYTDKELAAADDDLIGPDRGIQINMQRNPRSGPDANNHSDLRDL